MIRLDYVLKIRRPLYAQYLHRWEDLCNHLRDNESSLWAPTTFASLKNNSLPFVFFFDTKIRTRLPNKSKRDPTTTHEFGLQCMPIRSLFPLDATPLKIPNTKNLLPCHTKPEPRGPKMFAATYDTRVSKYEEIMWRMVQVNCKSLKRVL